MTTDVKVEMLEIIEVPVVVWIRVVGAEYEREEGCKRLRKVLGVRGMYMIKNRNI